MSRRDIQLTLESQQFDASALRVYRVRASERMSQPFHVEAEVVCPVGSPLDVGEVAGSSASVIIGGEREQRRFNGVISRVTEISATERERIPYRLELEPRLWQATMVETLDVHLDRSVPEIVEAKLALFDLAPSVDYALRLSGAYPKRDFVVQFRETDLAFMSRLLEHLGVFYYFEHDGKTERLVFGDDHDAYRAIAGDGSVQFHGRGDEVGIYELSYARGLCPTMFVCRDYNEATPAVDLQAEHRLTQGFAGGVVEYGGDFRVVEHGAQLVRARAEERLAGRDVFSGKSDELRLAPGHTFVLEGHPRHADKLVCLSLEHEAHDPIADQGTAPERTYRNSFTAIPADRTYRPPRMTPVPRVHGLLHGIIETAQGEIETYAKLDDEGRYTVRLMFDTSAPGERKASCPIRMLQPSAGPNYGTHFPLKPGIEVLIGFVDGNPDRPIIVGAASNPITPAPVNAAIATKSRIVTRSGILIEFEDANRRA